jgi:hypothetical protein
MFDPAKDCEREDCKIRSSGGSSTLAYYPPVYDKYGNNTNPDMNVTSYEKHCMTCEKSWSESWQNHERIR